MSDARTVIEQMIATANRNDLDAQAAYFAEDVTYRFDTYGVDTTGRDALRKVMDGFLSQFPDRRIAITGTIQEGQRVAVQFDYIATSPGGDPGLPPAGEPFVSRVCSVFEVRDGLIRSERDYLDRPS